MIAPAWIVVILFRPDSEVVEAFRFREELVPEAVRIPEFGAIPETQVAILQTHQQGIGT